MSNNNELQRILTEQNVAQENAKQLLEAFGAPFEEAGEILAGYQSIKVTSEDQVELMAEAREKRLALKKTRVEVEHKRKELKADILKTGKAIDSVAKFVEEIIEPAEAYLKQQEKFAEIRQAERKAQLKAERIEKLMQYTDDVSLYNFDEMTDDQFTSLHATLKAQHEAKLAEAKRLEDERIAQAKAEAEEQERIRQENIKLKAEAETREKAYQLEQAKLAKEQAKKDAEAQAIRDRIQKEADEKLAVERAEREKLEAENRARLQAEAEAKAKAEAEAEAKAKAEAEALLAPDKNKLIKFAGGLDIIRTTKLPAVKSNQAQHIVNKIEANLAKLAEAIREESKGL